MWWSMEVEKSFKVKNNLIFRLSIYKEKKMVIYLHHFFHQTKDPEFDEEVTKFRCMQKAAAALAQNIDAIVQGIKARHKAELEMARGVVAILLQAARTPEIEAMQKAASDSCNKVFKVFVSMILVLF